ncbi:SDR family NAD(P)-dependent oxidoreductase [Arthrobacter sp. CDRTa11]|uniref:SDR family NAD(P)-dependent oxidoreductase n=1 Tax=Arthrobacter sp. CDRTa11 TaxID=2651199 RepID=UPI002265A47E|nr:SDR family NAD(P)-dependent oxidoreductase [Arthrobacter sp. CDRTa11]UZX02857.1 SDR family NAD(P)-dependent oxidoreductase [Arthrobacter sp. CDRTa11]
MDLQGKVAVVTGSGRGLGLAYAKALAAAGASIVINDVDSTRVDEVVKELRSAGAEATGVAAPVGPTDTAERLVAAAVSAFGRLDILVANAGILRDAVLWKMTDEDFDAVVDVHLRGTFTCARAAARQMREQGEGGRLILIASPAGQRGNFGQTNYAAAKAGVVAMARTWAMELARANITVNAVIPVAATDMTRSIPALAPIFEESDRSGEPLPAWLRKDEGLGEVEDVAPLVSFLASEEAAGITGQAIGLGGDRLSLWSHPSEKLVLVAENGWSADLLAESWGKELAAQSETYGIPAPRIPEAKH